MPPYKNNGTRKKPTLVSDDGVVMLEAPAQVVADTQQRRCDITQEMEDIFNLFWRMF